MEAQGSTVATQSTRLRQLRIAPRALEGSPSPRLAWAWWVRRARWLFPGSVGKEQKEKGRGGYGLCPRRSKLT